MDVRLIEREIEDWLIAEKKKRDQQHNYLGFSHIGRCPRMLYDWLRYGHSDATKRAALNTESGLMFQRAALQLLIGAGRVDPDWLGMDEGDEQRVVHSGWDARFYGHVDARTNSGSLVEIKSFDRIGFEQVCATDKIGFAYYAQAQTYLRYARVNQMLFVAVNRDDRNMLDYHLIELRRDDRVGEEMERKAHAILGALDGKTPLPACTCGRHGQPRAPMSYQQTNATRVVRDDLTRRMEVRAGVR